VQMAISWLVDNYNRIAECYASARRVMVLVEASEAVESRLAGQDGAKIDMAVSADAAVRLAGVSVYDPTGRPLVNSASLSLARGERDVISGNTSAGKTALVRAIAGLWPWGRGRVEKPRSLTVMVMPQKAYMPMGTLRSALLYPFDRKQIGDDRLMDILNGVGLPHLAHRLSEQDRWDQILGTGERQRIAVARALVHAPDVLVVDDGLSSLEASAQTALLELVAAEMPHTAILTFGQRERVDDFDHRQLVLETRSGGSILRTGTGAEAAAKA
jgi:vitamin B12/bleomycin/antimicrobial peptide transport system ATP-binding/permease protein